MLASAVIGLPELVAPVAIPEGWRAELSLRFAERSGRTVLTERSHRGPLLVQRAFYPEPEECHVYLLHPPAGIVGGDDLNLNVNVDPHAQVLITSPAATKFYRSDGRIAKLTQRLCLAEGSVLEWLPQETLYFDGAIAQCRTEVHLHEEACFIGWDAQCFGRPCSGERYTRGQITQGWSIKGTVHASLRERLRLDAEAMTAVWGLRGQGALASLYAYPASKGLLEQARAVLADMNDCGCTLLDRLLVCRLVGDGVDRLRLGLEQVWRMLRPELLGRSACIPRIWTT
jgi:urease accessory protein